MFVKKTQQKQQHRAILHKQEQNSSGDKKVYKQMDRWLDRQNDNSS